ncbi:hypothetical protein K466DRAFT_281563 [Polyporus arcularius HHB13444]|uniref:Uncharacterized protein n=1 Tax=Polyporus arcularius HHB13444 TaxID=1314778 RepID=A0A5C3P2T2_9APHY|nr:hypothetical protein K466DRAFT_281563 [Polyporus arcularius HHB13444]
MDHVARGERVGCESTAPASGTALHNANEVGQARCGRSLCPANQCTGRGPGEARGQTMPVAKISFAVRRFWRTLRGKERRCSLRTACQLCHERWKPPTWRAPRLRLVHKYSSLSRSLRSRIVKSQLTEPVHPAARRSSINDLPTPCRLINSPSSDMTATLTLTNSLSSSDSSTGAFGRILRINVQRSTGSRRSTIVPAENRRQQVGHHASCISTRARPQKFSEAQGAASRAGFRVPGFSSPSLLLSLS